MKTSSKKLFLDRLALPHMSTNFWIAAVSLFVNRETAMLSKIISFTFSTDDFADHGTPSSDSKPFWPALLWHPSS